MPIISRQLTNIQNNSDGTIFAAFEGTDALGVIWMKSRSRFVDLDAAQVALDAYDWTPQLRDRDFQDVLSWVQALNPVSTFDLTGRDITEDDGEEFIMVWFAGKLGDEAVTVAWWLDSINTGQFNQIRDRVPFTGVQGATITSKFTFLLAAEPWWDVVVEPN